MGGEFTGMGGEFTGMGGEFTGMGGRGSSRDMTPENTSFRGAMENLPGIEGYNEDPSDYPTDAQIPSIR
jgi:hypothetical protein